MMDRIPDSKCDFCGRPMPTWAFPAQNFYHKTRMPSAMAEVNAFMKDGWAACDSCMQIVHEGNARKLARQVMRDPKVANTLSARLFRNELLDTVVKMQDVFRRNRLSGPPIRIRQ